MRREIAYAAAIRSLKAASSSSIGSRSPVAAEAIRFLAISVRLADVRMAGESDAIA